MDQWIELSAEESDAAEAIKRAVLHAKVAQADADMILAHRRVETMRAIEALNNFPTTLAFRKAIDASKYTFDYDLKRFVPK